MRYCDDRKELITKVSFKRKEVCNKSFGKLRINSREGFNYQICGVHHIEVPLAMANLNDEELKVKVLFHDSTTTQTHTVLDYVFKPHDEGSIQIPMEFDGKLKVETASLEFIVDGKSEGLVPMSFILWDEANEELQKSWKRKVFFKYNNVGCKADNDNEVFNVLELFGL